MEIFLGVDGGGSHSTFVLIDSSGTIRAQSRAGCAYHPQVGLDGVRQTFTEGFSALLEAARLAPAEISSGFFAIPAYGEDSRLLATLDKLPSALLPQERYRCGNDMVSGWCGAFAGADGVNVVAGTGSIAYGEFNGRSARAGGWGELFSDEGSAYWIAREGLNLFSRMSDGRSAPGPLLDIVRGHLKLSSDLDLCAAIYGDLAGARSDVAGFAPLMSEAQAAGDRQVEAIFARAANELVGLVLATRKSLGVPHEHSLPVSYSGGMFREPSPILQRFRNALTSGALPFTLAEPRFSPAVGAALYAALWRKFVFDAPALAHLADQCRSARA
jgi:N-acetylglucosamine kinase-like BadF-type ATPase